MRYETVHNLSIPKIGFGTWKIGGGFHADPRTDSVSTAALRSALGIGYTHFDTAEMYAGGPPEELIGQIVPEMRIKRETLFITLKEKPSHLQLEKGFGSFEKNSPP